MLGGPKTFGAPQGNLPWTDEEIAKTWVADSYAEYGVVATSAQNTRRTFRHRQTMIHRDGISYLLRDQVWEGDKQTQDDGRPRMWVAYLGLARRTPAKFLKTRGATVEAAGRKWPCDVIEVSSTKKSTWYLSREIPGLTVQYVSEDANLKVVRTLSATSLRPPSGPK